MSDRATRLATLVDDLAGEADALDQLLVTLDSDAWLTPTPALGWDVRDSVGHIATGDEMALECVVSNRVPSGMKKGLEAVLEGNTAMIEFERHLLSRGRQMAIDDVHRWWRDGNASLTKALADVEEDRRLPWGPNMMSPASFVTARIMETWAHGLDCFDAVGVTPTDSDRLRHVADLAARSLPYAFMIRGIDAPGEVRFELTSPSGDTWNLGGDDAPTVIRGTASDWCRVAVHRDRRDEADRIDASGPDAADVLRYVQAYL